MIYVASRVRHAAMWQAKRDAGAPILSTWIDEAGEGQSASMAGLWERIISEVSRCSSLLFYVEPGDLPLKGALVEVGAALALGKPVVACLPGIELEPQSDRPIGSWIRHPLVMREDDLGYILRVEAESKVE